MSAENIVVTENEVAIDFKFFREIVGEDKEFEKELFEIFIDNSNKNISLMDEAVKNSDNNAWYMSSHAFKGSCASVGAFNLSKLLQKAQSSSDDDKESKILILKEVREGFKEVEKIVNKEIF